MQGEDAIVFSKIKEVLPLLYHLLYKKESSAGDLISSCAISLKDAFLSSESGGLNFYCKIGVDF